MQLTERERRLQEARRAAAQLVMECHQVPVDLSRGPNVPAVRKSLARIKTVVADLERVLAGIDEALQEFRE